MSEVAKQLAASTKLRKALGGLAVTLALVGGAEVKSNQVAEAQTESNKEYMIECPAGQNPHWLEDSDGDERPDANEMGCNEYAPKCVYSTVASWEVDYNGDNQPGPTSSEFRCYGVWGCRLEPFLYWDRPWRLYETGVITSAQNSLFSRDVYASGKCPGDDPTSLEDFDLLLESEPWIEQLFRDNPWLGETKVPGYEDLKPWNVDYVNSIFSQDTTEPEPTTTTDSTVVEQEDLQPPEETQDTTEPEPTTTTDSTVVEQEDSQTPEETQDTTEPEPTTTTDSTVVEQEDSQTPEETQDTTEPETTTTTDSTVVEQEDLQPPEETQDTTEPETTTTTDSTVVEPEEPQAPEETQDTTEPEPTTTTDSTVVEQEDTDGGRTELIVGGVVAASVLSLTAVTTYLRLRRRRSL